MIALPFLPVSLVRPGGGYRARAAQRKPAPIEARRHEVAKAIERLSKPAPARP